jgi:ectoine hydroxylase-related dioxygenase (phytanoyl-CoA dioxygenase family)
MAVTDALLSSGPSITDDIDQAKSDLSTFGFCIVAAALTDAAVDAARTRLVEQADGEEELGLSFRDGGSWQQIIDSFGSFREDAFSAANGGVNQRVWMLTNKGRCFRDMVVHELTDELVGHVLGSQFIVSTLSANIAKPGGVRMGLHTDQWWMPQPTRPGPDYLRPSEITRAAAGEFVEPDTRLGIAPPVVANCMWMLSDFTADNGATEVVPGSHLTGAHPSPDDQSALPIVRAVAPAGSLMVFDGRLWHGTGAHRAGEDRLGVLATYCAPQFRQQENQTIGIDPELFETLSTKLKERLGFKVWNAYGRVESPAATLVGPNPERIGELRPG